MARTKQGSGMTRDARTGQRQKRTRRVGGKAPRKSRGSGQAGVKKPHRYRPGTVALREIRRFQKSTDLLIPKQSFQKSMREVVHDTQSDLNAMGALKILTEPPRVTCATVECLQSASEAIITKTLEDANALAVHANRVTVQPKDLGLAIRLSQEPSLDGWEIGLLAERRRLEREAAANKERRASEKERRAFALANASGA